MTKRFTWRGNLAAGFLALVLVVSLWLMITQPSWMIDLSATAAGGLFLGVVAPFGCMLLWAVIRIDRRH